MKIKIAENYAEMSRAAADIFAEVIEHVHNYKEISSLFYK